MRCLYVCVLIVLVGVAAGDEGSDVAAPPSLIGGDIVGTLLNLVKNLLAGIIHVVVGLLKQLATLTKIIPLVGPLIALLAGLVETLGAVVQALLDLIIGLLTGGDIKKLVEEFEKVTHEAIDLLKENIRKEAFFGPIVIGLLSPLLDLVTDLLATVLKTVEPLLSVV